MGNGTVVTVSLNPKRVQEIERAGGRGAAVRPETEAAGIPPARERLRSSPWRRSRCSPPWGRCSSPELLPAQEPQATSLSPRGAKHAGDHAARRIWTQQHCSRQTGAMPGGAANGLPAVPAGISIPSRCRQLGYGQPYPAAVSSGVPAAVSADTAGAIEPLGPADAVRSLTNSGRKVFNSRCRRCRVLNNQQLK